MNKYCKYIDAERLIAEIESINLFPQISADYNDGREDMKMVILDIIDSLQQEQSESSNGKFKFPKFLYARTLDNKTIDVSYAPQSLVAIEYVRNDYLQQEQPRCVYGWTLEEREKYCKFCSAVCKVRTEQEQVDLEKEIVRVVENYNSFVNKSKVMKPSGIEKIARHFYELGLNVRKEE